MIVLSSNNDSTYKQRRKYLQDTKMIAINLWDNVPHFETSIIFIKKATKKLQLIDIIHIFA